MALLFARSHHPAVAGDDGRLGAAGALSALAETAAHAGPADGQRVPELGCGAADGTTWGVSHCRLRPL